MKYNLFLCGFLLTASIAQGQKETFDILTFTPPVGYQRQEGKGTVQFTRKLDNGGYCKFVVFASRAAGDDAMKEFTEEWHECIKSNDASAGAPEKTEKLGPEKGWMIVSGEATIKNSVGEHVAVLVSIIGHGRATSVSIETNAESFTTDIEEFISKLEPDAIKADALTLAAKPKEIKPLVSSAAAVTTTSTTALTPNSSQIVGVWSGFGTTSTSSRVENAGYTGYTQFTGSKLRVRYVAFFEDGSFCNWVTEATLLDHAKERAKSPDYWGAYTFEKGAGVIRFTPALAYDIVLKNEVFTYEKTDFNKLPRTDHLRMDGTFTAEKNPAAYTGPEPTITFTLDGRFDDHSAIYWTRHVKSTTADMQDQQTGSGTYDIFNYVITFKYDDGRLIRMMILDAGSPDKTKPNQIRLGDFHLLDRK